MPTTIDAGKDRSGVVTGLPRVLLRSEGVALLAMAAVLYGRQGQSWWLFVALLAVPDWGLLGYVVGARAGAVAYDLTHTYLPPAVLALGGVLGGSSLAVSVALIWFAHIGMDRALGLGLRYPDRSRHSHLDGDRASRQADTRRRPPRAHVAVLLAVLLVSVAACSRSQASDTARRVERGPEVAATETLSRRMRDLAIDSPALDRYAMVRLLLPPVLALLIHL